MAGRIQLLEKSRQDGTFPLDGRGFLLLGQSFLGSVQLIATTLLSDVLV
jgi:hypothetical protein